MRGRQIELWLGCVGMLVWLGCSADVVQAGTDASDVADTAGTADAAAETEDAAPDSDAEPTTSVAETLGLTVYAGAITPIVEDTAGAVTTYTFDAQEGPACMRGAPYRLATRKAAASDNLVIFLQGGGACWSDFCFAVTSAPAGMPSPDILDPDLEANPVRTWNAVYLPYCDGSFFAGDATHDDDLNGNGTRTHRGLANLTAALEIAAAEFPNPPKVLLAGSSGGAYGLMLGLPLARHYFPDAELIGMADSGIGLARDGDQAFLDGILAEFNLERFIPADCPGCTDGGHITGLIGWYLDRDPNARIGMFSAWYDAIIANVFLDVDPADYAAAMETQTDAIRAAHPDRFRRFIVDGIQHTALLGDATGIIGSDLGAVELPAGLLENVLGVLELGELTTTAAGGQTLADWLGGMVDNDLTVWVDVVDPKGAPPPP